jgi:hypothetical protein
MHAVVFIAVLAAHASRDRKFDQLPGAVGVYRIKESESHLDSAVASYFTFLRWLFWVNMMIFILLTTFVAVPEVSCFLCHQLEATILTRVARFWGRTSWTTARPCCPKREQTPRTSQFYGTLKEFCATRQCFTVFTPTGTFSRVATDCPLPIL